MSAGWPEPPGGNLGHTHHRRNQGPEGQFDLLPPRTPLGLWAAGQQLRTWPSVSPRGNTRGWGRPPAVLFHRYAGSQSPWLSGTHIAHPRAALRCSALVPPLSPPGFGCSSQKLTDFTITLGPGSAAGGPTPATSASHPSRPQSLLGGCSWGCLLIFSARKPGALGWGALALCSSLLMLRLWLSGGRSCHALLCLLGCPRLQPHLSIPTQSSNSESWGAEVVSSV